MQSGSSRLGGSRRILACLIALAATACAPAASQGATIAVDTTADEYGTGSGCGLREALRAAEDDLAFGGCGAGAGADVVNLPPGTYGLTRVSLEISPNVGINDLDVLSPVTIQNAGRRPAVIDANGGDRVFSTLASDPGIQLVGLTIRGGHAQGDGGGVNNAGKLTVRDSTLTDNLAEGGEGGAIYTAGNGSTLSLENVTVSGNRADESGGGISLAGGTNSIRNATVSANVTDADGTGGPTFGGGVFANVGVTSYRDTIIARNSDLTPTGLFTDCAGQGLGSDGHNLVADPDGCDQSNSPPSSDLIGADPMLGSLADNGGPAATLALLAGSDALEKGSGSGPAADQRGAPRAGTADIGAYERVLCAGRLVNRVGTTGRDRLRGTGGADGILALAGKDILKGLRGADALCGAGGRDRLIGGPGRDKLLGGAGRDRLIGGPGRDRLRGGPGRDKQVQ